MSLKSVPGTFVSIAPTGIGVPVALTPGFGPHDEVLAAALSPEERISAFMAYAFDFIRSHPCRPLFESESGFVMSYLLDHLPSLREELLHRLGDALDTVPAVAAGTLGKDQLADVIVRLFASSWIIPETDDASLVQSVNRILQISTEENNE